MIVILLPYVGILEALGVWGRWRGSCDSPQRDVLHVSRRIWNAHMNIMMATQAAPEAIGAYQSSEGAESCIR